MKRKCSLSLVGKHNIVKVLNLYVNIIDAIVCVHSSCDESSKILTFNNRIYLTFQQFQTPNQEIANRIHTTA